MSKVAKNTAPAKEAPKAEAKPKAAKVEAPKAEPTAEEVVESNRVGRKELAAVLREKVMATGLAVSQKVAEAAVVAYEEAVQELLAGGMEVNLPGFGKFVSVAKDAAVKRNPKTGEDVNVPAHNSPKFKVGSKFKAAVNAGVETEGEEE